MQILIDKIFAFGYKSGDVFQNVAYEGYELTYFASGTGTMSSNDKTFTYRPNDILFATPEYVRKLSCTEDTNYFCIRFRILDPLNDLSYGVYPCVDDYIFALMKSVFQEYKDKPYRYYDSCNLKVGEVLILLARRIAENASTDRSFHDLIREIDSTLLFERSVKEMADSLNYSYDYFRHKFKGITGQSPSEYIANKRLENACKLLKQNKYTCTEISNLCGFSSPSQFSKLFKRELGVNPLSYRS